MLDRQIPDVDLDELMEKIRAEVSRRKDGASVGRTGSPDFPANGGSVYTLISSKWVQVENALSMAEQVSQVGTRLPGMHSFQGWKRKLASLIGKIYLRISQVITRDQRAFNGSMLVAVRSLQEKTKQIEASMTKNSEYMSHVDNLHVRVDSVESNNSKQLSDISFRLSHMQEELSSRLNESQSEIENLSLEYKKTLQKIDYLKTSLLLQERRLTLLIEEARRRMPEPFSKEQLESLIEKASDYYDPLYFEFEDEFRGTREDIKERQRIFLPYIREAGAGTEERPVLDLGCGRGEWLELLKEEGFIARGVDMNMLMISLCNDMGLVVTKDDVLKYLRELPDGSLGAVTGFHIVEHLPFEVLIKLFDESIRVLKPGGIAIFETPNPENIQVGSCNFYFDPTHKNPLPSSMLKFMVEARGLCRVSVLNLHPSPESYWLSGSELAERFSQLFYGPKDYAVVGWKA